VSTETIPELLASLEREHVRNPIGQGAAVGERCVCGERWPCQSDSARLVAHARSLEAALRELLFAIEGGLPTKTQIYHDVRAALGEAQ
jgi:hypothetical protein